MDSGQSRGFRSCPRAPRIYVIGGRDRRARREAPRRPPRAQEAQARRNEASKAIGAAMGKGDTATAEALKAEVAGLKDMLAEVEARSSALGASSTPCSPPCPTSPPTTCPRGRRAGNVESRAVGGQQRNFTFDAQGAFRPRREARPDGFRDRREAVGRALRRSRRASWRGWSGRSAQFMLDLQTGEHGYTEVQPPLLVRDEAMFGTGQLPKFGDDLFRTTNGHWLIPTAEVSLTNLGARARSSTRTALPMRCTALTPCFRVGGGRGGQGHARHDPPASVLEGRAGFDHAPRSSRTPSTSA